MCVNKIGGGDHRKLGQELDLFSIQEEAGGWVVKAWCCSIATARARGGGGWSWTCSAYRRRQVGGVVGAARDDISVCMNKKRGGGDYHKLGQELGMISIQEEAGGWGFQHHDGHGLSKV
jgi:hypothetical protein